MPKPTRLRFSSSQRISSVWRLPVPLTVASELKYHFTTSDSDISFALKFKPAYGAERVLMSHDRVPAHENPAIGRIDGPNEEGVLIFEWDNSYSWASSNKLTYQIDLFEITPGVATASTDDGEFDESAAFLQSLVSSQASELNRQCDLLSNQTAVIEDLRRQVESSSSQIAQLNAENEDLRVELEAVKIVADDSNVGETEVESSPVVENLREEIARLMVLVESLTLECVDHKSSADRLRDEVEQEKATNWQLRHVEIPELKEKLDEAGEQASVSKTVIELEESIRVLQRQHIEELESRSSESDKCMRELTAALKLAHEEEIVGLKAQVQSLEKQLSTLRRQSDKLDVDADQLSAMNNRLNVQIREKQTEIAALNIQLDEKRLELAEEREKNILEREALRLELLNQQDIDQEAREEELAQMAATHEAIAKLTGQMESYRRSSIERHDDLVVKCRNAESLALDLGDELERAKAALDKALADKSALERASVADRAEAEVVHQDEISSLQKQLESTRGLLAQMEKQRDRSGDEVRRLEDQLAELRDQQSDLLNLMSDRQSEWEAEKSVMVREHDDSLYAVVALRTAAEVKASDLEKKCGALEFQFAELEARHESILNEHMEEISELDRRLEIERDPSHVDSVAYGIVKDAENDRLTWETQLAHLARSVDVMSQERKDLEGQLAANRISTELLESSLREECRAVKEERDGLHRDRGALQSKLMQLKSLLQEREGEWESERSKLQQEIEDQDVRYSAEIANLKEHTARQTLRNEALRESNEQLKGQVEGGLIIHKQLQSKVREMEGQLTGFANELETIRIKHQDEVERLQDTHVSELRAVHDQLSRQKSRFDTLSTDQANLQQQLAASDMRCKDLQSRIRQLESALSASSAELEEKSIQAQNDIEELQRLHDAAAKSFEDQILRLKSRNDSLGAELALLRQQLQAEEDTNQTLHTRVLQLDLMMIARGNELEANVAKSQNEIDQLNEIHDDAIRDLKDQVGRLKSRNENLSLELSTLNEQVNHEMEQTRSLARELKKSQDREVQLIREFDNRLNADKEEWNEQLASKEDEIKDLRAQLTSARRASSRQSLTHARTDDEMSKLQEDFDAQMHINESLRADNAELDVSISKLENELLKQQMLAKDQLKAQISKEMEVRKELARALELYEETEKAKDLLERTLAQVESKHDRSEEDKSVPVEVAVLQQKLDTSERERIDTNKLLLDLESKLLQQQQQFAVELQQQINETVTKSEQLEKMEDLVLKLTTDLEENRANDDYVNRLEESYRKIVLDLKAQIQKIEANYEEESADWDKTSAEFQSEIAVLDRQKTLLEEKLRSFDGELGHVKDLEEKLTKQKLKISMMEVEINSLKQGQQPLGSSVGDAARKGNRRNLDVSQ